MLKIKNSLSCFKNTEVFVLPYIDHFQSQIVSQIFIPIQQIQCA